MHLLPVVKSKDEPTIYIDFYCPILREGFFIRLEPIAGELTIETFAELRTMITDSNRQPPYSFVTWKSYLKDTLDECMKAYQQEHPFTPHRLNNVFKFKYRT